MLSSIQEANPKEFNCPHTHYSCFCGLYRIISEKCTSQSIRECHQIISLLLTHVYRDVSGVMMM